MSEQETLRPHYVRDIELGERMQKIPSSVPEFVDWTTAHLQWGDRRRELLSGQGWNFETPFPQQRFTDESRRAIQKAWELGILRTPPLPNGSISFEEREHIYGALRDAALAIEGTDDLAGTIDDDSFLSPKKLAELFHVARGPLDSRLKRWRKSASGGWMENPDRTSREPLFLYRYGSIRCVIESLRVTGKRPTKKI